MTKRGRQPLCACIHVCVPVPASVRLSVCVCVSVLVLYLPVGRSGALVESKPFDVRVVGSNPILAATYGPMQVLNSQLSAALRRETPVHMSANPGGYPGYSPSKNLSGGAKHCTSPHENDEIASLH